VWEICCFVWHILLSWRGRKREPLLAVPVCDVLSEGHNAEWAAVE
jgi:hypothetical protein